jgi:hypothetical protein
MSNLEHFRYWNQVVYALDSQGHSLRSDEMHLACEAAEIAAIPSSLVAAWAGVGLIQSISRCLVSALGGALCRPCRYAPGCPPLISRLRAVHAIASR